MDSVLTLRDLLARAIESSGSDVHLTAGVPPFIRVDGELQPLDGIPEMSDGDIRDLVSTGLTDDQLRRFDATSELDCSFDVSGVSRVRCNLFRQRGTVAAVLRLIPDAIRSFDELELPRVVAGFARKPRGLVLVTGPTGSGKSTTLAALIDMINIERRGHVLTIEDPIEYVHVHKNCLVRQREVHTDTASFAPALRAALREDPDVVMIGEMRDLETIEAALRIAETGHLTLATLHTSSAMQTVHRIVDVFPPHRQEQVCAQLSLTLQGIVCQSLVRKADGKGRVAAVEVLVPTPAVRHLIRDNKVHQLYSAMQTGSDHAGMQTMNQALLALYTKRAITFESALEHSSNPTELEEMLKRRSGARRPEVAGSRF